MTAQDVGCRALKGRPSTYQEVTSRVIFVQRATTVMPWHWVSWTCATEYCIEATHLVIKSPQKLLYPAGICVYCGLSASTRDHLLPISMTGKAARRYVLTVPACGECNGSIGDRGTASITHRRALAQEKIRRKYAKKLLTRDWSDADLDEFGPNLRAHVSGAMADKSRVLDRLAWPFDPAFDLQALERSGIPDPYATGLLGMPTERAA